MSRTLALALLSLALVACGGSGDEEEAAPAAPAATEQLTDLDNVLDLRAAFNEDDGRPRLILLLSPT